MLPPCDSKEEGGFIMTVQEAKALIRPMLDEKRYHHSMCVAKEAVRLAKRFGADPEKAELAGILHDIVKQIPAEKQLQMLDGFAIILTETERKSRKIWHAILGAAYLERECGVTDPELLSAVRWHTTGKAGMTLLDRIVFTADFVSEDREYKGVEKLRRLAEKDLNAAMLEGTAFTIADLASHEALIHPDTVSLYNSLLLEREKAAKAEK